MASNIVPDTIDDAYPVTGQDNDSQGFRDNFNTIKTNFTYSKQEIENLQDNTAKTNEENNFFENDLLRYNSRQQTHEHAIVSASVTQELSFENAHHFEVTLPNDTTLTLVGWPTNNQYAEMIMQIFHDSGSPRAVGFAAEYSTGIPSTLRVEDTTEFGGSAAIATDAVNNKCQLIKAFSYDNGITVYLQHIGTFVAAA